MKSIITFCFSDSKILTDEEYVWSEHSYEVNVDTGQSIRTLLICNENIDKIKIEVEDRILVLNVEDRKVFYFIQSQTDFFPDGTQKTKDIGKIVGFLNNDKIEEEYYVDEQFQEITGIKTI
jgi:hypothetical protein